MKKIKKIFNVIINIFCILIIVLNIYIIFNNIVLKNNTISAFGYSALIVISGSMEPEISVDDLILIKSQDEYTLDDIVTYKTTNSLVTHRIIRIDEEKIYTKGDSNNTEDDPIKVEQIYGKVVYNIKGIGKVISFITKPTTISVLLGSTFLFIIIARNNKKYIRKGKYFSEKSKTF